MNFTVAVVTVNKNDYGIHFFVYEQRWSHKFIKKCWFDWKKQNIIKHENLLSHIKMGKEFITFRDIEIEKHDRYKIPIVLEDVDIDSVL